MKNWKPKKDPWHPPDYDDETVLAFRAFHAGLTNKGQQQLVWSWLMYVTGAGDEFADMSYRPGPNGDRDTVFAEGKRFPGLQMRKMLHPMMTPKAMTTEKIQPNDTRKHARKRT